MEGFILSKANPNGRFHFGVSKGAKSTRLQ